MNDFLKGIAAGLTAGAFWGLSFLVPRILSTIPASQIATGRFVFFGIFSLFAFMFHARARNIYLIKKYFKMGLFLSLSGYSLYYYLLAESIQLIGIPFSSLLIGLLPITIALGSRDTVSSKKTFYLGLVLIASGVFCLNLGAFASMSQINTAGITLSLVCLVLWSAFAIFNSRFLKSHPEVTAREWSNVLGLLSGLSALVMAIISSAIKGTHIEEFTFAWSNPLFIFLTATLGFASTWLATRLWNLASRSLPTGLVAQLIVSETIFALLYSFIYENKMPASHEWLAMTLLIGGVLMGIRAFQKV